MRMKNRRDFIKTLLGLGGAVIATSFIVKLAPAQESVPVQQPKKLTIAELIGRQTEIDMEKTKRADVLKKLMTGPVKLGISPSPFRKH
jgi:hypothetical protein